MQKRFSRVTRLVRADNPVAGFSLIKSKFMRGTETEISFQVGSSPQKYNVADVGLLKFGSEVTAEDRATLPKSSLSSEPGPVKPHSAKPASSVIVPAGTRIFVPTIDGTDSTKKRAGRSFSSFARRAADNWRKRGGRRAG